MSEKEYYVCQPVCTASNSSLVGPLSPSSGLASTVAASSFALPTSSWDAQERDP